MTLHTLGDPLVPYWHDLFYRQRVEAAGSGHLFASIPSFHYGHCNFTTVETLLAFAVLVYRVTGHLLPQPERVLTTPEARAQYQDRARAYGLGS